MAILLFMLATIFRKGLLKQEDMGSLSRAKEGEQEGTPAGETRILPRSGLVQLLIRWKAFRITFPVICWGIIHLISPTSGLCRQFSAYYHESCLFTSSV